MISTTCRNYDLLPTRAGARDKAIVVDAAAAMVRLGFDLRRVNG